jgi:hypothetical protein
VHPYHLKSTKTIVGGTKKSILKLENCNLMLLFVIREYPKNGRIDCVICPVWVTNIISIEDNFQMITDFGQLLMLVQKPESGTIN